MNPPKNSEFILPQSCLRSGIYPDDSIYRVDEFSDGTVCTTITYPDFPQNTVIFDRERGTPTPESPDWGRCPFTERVGLTRMARALGDKAIGDRSMLELPAGRYYFDFSG